MSLCVSLKTSVRSESLQQSDNNSEIGISDSGSDDSELDEYQGSHAHHHHRSSTPTFSSREEKFGKVASTGNSDIMSDKRSRKQQSRKGVKDMQLLVANPAYDIWSLGVVFYQIACNVPLFLCDGDGNMGDSDLRVLAEWTDKVKSDKLAKIKNPLARNLLSIMLQRDPKRRPTVETVLKHPFLSFHRSRPTLVVGGETITREFDVFISYRVATDLPHVELLHKLLTKAGLKVWWDKTR